MFALLFQFPGGRYHATPWGRHVNEGAVAWPPEPYRVLRALIAVWHRKADQVRWDQSTLHRLIEALAEKAPVYRLPAAVHAHTRHYMPQGTLDKDRREATTLVFDAFFRIDRYAELVIAWPDLMLKADTFALAEHLAELIGYLGRAESTVIAGVTAVIDGDFPVEPMKKTTIVVPGWTTVDVLVPLTPSQYADQRPRLLSLNADKPHSKDRDAFEATLPAAFTDALQVETNQFQAVGWSRPPAGQSVVYVRPEVGPRPPARARPRAEEREKNLPTVARFILAGRPRPSITDAVKIGEVFRQALMARIDDPIPAVLSGRDESGVPLSDPRHSHAFFLPEDHDRDGQIDHLVLFARDGLNSAVRRAAENVTILWTQNSRQRDHDDAGDSGRREWRLALEGFDVPEHFNDSDLLCPSATWISVTPYLRPRHTKGSDPQAETCEMVRIECLRRGLPIKTVTFDGASERFGSEILVGRSRRSVLHFSRSRSRRGLIQPDRSGSAIRLVFDTPIPGPIALGFGCHFGLGLFRADSA
jgi:CRISPR-associated protein Csb2